MAAPTRLPRRQALLTNRTMAGACAILCLLQTALQFPGTLSSDDLDQLRQISTGIVDDWRAPIIARLWQGVFLLGGGTYWLFLLSVCAFWAALAIFAIVLRNAGRRKSALLVPLVGLVPALLYRMGTLSSDTLFAALFLLGFALIALARTGSDRQPAMIAGLALISFAALFRHNAVFALGPAFVYASDARTLRRPLLCLTLSALIALAGLPVVGLVNRDLLGAVHTRVVDSLRLFDLAGIAEISGDSTVFGADSRLTHADIDRCYTPVAWDTLSEPGRCGWFSRRAGLGASPDALRSVDRGPSPIGPLWRHAILRHPVAYAGHRVAHFNSATFFLVAPGHRNSVWPADTEIRPANGIGQRIAHFLRYSLLFAPAFLLSIGLAIAVALGAHLRRATAPIPTAAFTLCLSGLAYGASYLVVGVASVERYFLFSDFAVLIAVVLAAGDGAFRECLASRLALLAFCILLPAATLATMYAGRALLPTPPVVGRIAPPI